MKIFSKRFSDLWNLRLTMFESVITSGLISMSIMTLFYYSIGMSNEEIAISQVIFSIVMIFLDLPMGWVADRFGRKWSNVIGDFGEALIFLYYSQAQGMTDVVVAECLLAVFSSLSAGVDGSLLRHFSQKIKPGEKYFRSKTATVSLWQHIAQMVLVGLGGPIGAIDYRLAIALSGVVYVIGGLASLFIHDDSERISASVKNPFKDIKRIIKETLKNPKLRLRILIYVFGREMTHSMIWFFTPILILAGVPVEIVSLAWVANALAATIGSKIAKEKSKKFKDWQLYLVPICLVAISMGALAINISLFTVPLYLLMGVTQGWTGATLKPMIQECAKPSEQTSIISLTSTTARLLYVVVQWLIGWSADISLQLPLLVTLVVFVPIGTILMIKLKREC